MLTSSTSHQPVGSLPTKAKCRISQPVAKRRFVDGQTFGPGPNNSCVGHEDVQSTKTGHRSCDRLFCLLDIAYVGGESDYLSGGLLAEDYVPAYVQCLLLSRDKSQSCASTSIMYSSLETDATGCARNQHDLSCICMVGKMDLRIDERVDADFTGFSLALGERKESN